MVPLIAKKPLMELRTVGYTIQKGIRTTMCLMVADRPNSKLTAIIVTPLYVRGDHFGHKILPTMEMMTVTKMNREDLTSLNLSAKEAIQTLPLKRK